MHTARGVTLCLPLEQTLPAGCRCLLSPVVVCTHALCSSCRRAATLHSRTLLSTSGRITGRDSPATGTAAPPRTPAVTLATQSDPARRRGSWRAYMCCLVTHSDRGAWTRSRKPLLHPAAVALPRPRRTAPHDSSALPRDAVLAVPGCCTLRPCMAAHESNDSMHGAPGTPAQAAGVQTSVMAVPPRGDSACATH